MHFTIIGEIKNVELLATGSSVRIRKHLVQRFGSGRWRKMKGEATIRVGEGTVRKRNLD